MGNHIIATPPGATIKEQLEDREMSQKEFAARMDMSEKHISRLINGEVRLTQETAVRLEMVLGVPAGFWNKLEAIYREKIIKAEAMKNMEREDEISRRIPYDEMVKLTWIPEAGNENEKKIHLRKYFELVSLSLLGNEPITRIACRKLKTVEKGDMALLSWAQEARIKAREIQTGFFNIKKLTGSLTKIREMTTLKPKIMISKIKSCLADCGVALVFLPPLKDSFLEGISFTTGNKIVIVLEEKETTDDRFWFGLCHEIAHIVLGHMERTNALTGKDEKDADRWAADFLISSGDFKRFKNEKDYSEKSVIRFAKELEIAPGIVVGRMQMEKMIKPGMLNRLKEKYEMQDK